MLTVELYSVSQKTIESSMMIFTILTLIAERDTQDREIVLFIMSFHAIRKTTKM